MYELTENVSIVKNDKISVKIQHDALWLLIFHYNSAEGGLFKDKYEAKFNLDPNKFSLLTRIQYVQRFSSKYEFLLEYPEVNTYVIWQQSSNLFMPESDTFNQRVKGYKAIRVDSQPQFSGLSLSKQSSYCLLDGTSAQYLWYYAIGVKTNNYAEKSGYIPGPVINYESKYVNHVALWVHFPLQSQYTCKAKTRFVSPRILALFIIIQSPSIYLMGFLYIKEPY